MTISTTVCKVSHAGDGVTVTFAFNFLIPEGAIRVYVTENGTSTLVDPNTYGVVGFGNANGGSITFTVAPSASQIVTIRRYLNPTQTEDLLPSMTTYVDKVEGVLDRHAMVMQQLGCDLSRAVLVPEGSTQTPDEMLEDILQGRDGTPIGQIAAFAMSAVPNGWLECNGAAISRSTFADLFTAIGETYGSGDGSTTFKLPDLRGEFLRGLDNDRGVDAGRLIGSAQADAFQSFVIGTDEGAKAREHQYSANAGANVPKGGLYTSNAIGDTGFVLKPISNGENGTPRMTNETRPRNVAVVYCIKAFHVSVNPTELDLANLANDVAQNASDIVQSNLRYALLREELPDGVNGGSVLSGNWNDRNISFVKQFDQKGCVNTSGAEFTLAAGEYYVKTRCPFFYVGGVRTRLFNVTDNLPEHQSVSESGAIGNTSYYNSNMYVESSFLLSIETSKTFKIQYFSQLDYGEAGLGSHDAVNAGVECYSTVELEILH